MGHLWAAFSPATGETSLLNDESALIVELLRDGVADTRTISLALAEETGLPADSLVEVVATAWPTLVEAGLVRAQYACRCSAT